MHKRMASQLAGVLLLLLLSLITGSFAQTPAASLVQPAPPQQSSRVKNWAWTTQEWAWPTQRAYPGEVATAIAVPHRQTPPRTAQYRTEPDHMPIRWDVQYMTNHTERLAPGFWFISARSPGHEFGPKIIDQHGELIWDSKLTSIQGIVEIFQVCPWQGEHGTHICWREDNPRYLDSHHRGFWVLDNTYTEIAGPMLARDDGLTHPMASIDPHEFHMLPSGDSFTYVLRLPIQKDLRDYGGGKDGWVRDNCIAEADVYTGSAFFVWCALEQGVDVWETDIYPRLDGQTNQTSLIAGNSKIQQSPWDFMHTNSVDRNTQGLYFISGRHMNTIYIVAGPENSLGLKVGSIIHRAGGKLSDFHFPNNFKYSKQHHIRHVMTNNTGYMITLFDNAWEGYTPNPPTAQASSGMVIWLNNQTMQAQIVRRYKHPQGKLSGSRGGFDFLPSGNAVASWGYGVTELTEWANDGAVLAHIAFEYPECGTYGGMYGCNGVLPFSYRGHKVEWHARPHWKPKVIAYSASCFASNTRPVAYASWNGATEIAAWRFSVRNTPQDSWEPVANVKKTTFETQAFLVYSGDAIRPWVRAEALDAKGKVLGDQVTRVYVPNAKIAETCNNLGCPPRFRYEAGDVLADCLSPSPPATAPAPALSPPRPALTSPPPTASQQASATAAIIAALPIHKTPSLLAMSGVLVSAVIVVAVCVCAGRKVRPLLRCVERNAASSPGMELEEDEELLHYVDEETHLKSHDAIFIVDDESRPSVDTK